MGIINFFSHLFDTQGFPPRWFCGSAWTTELGYIHIISDLVIFASYISIPISIVIASGKQPIIKGRSLAVLFVSFILLCGIGHLVEATLFYYPWYRLSGFLKILIALVSLGTAIILGVNMKKYLKIPHEIELKKYLDFLIEKLPNPFIIIDKNGLIKSVNTKTLSYTGYSYSELMGQSYKFLLPEYTDQQAQNIISRILKSNERPVEIANMKIKNNVTKKVEISIAFTKLTHDPEFLISIVDIEQKFELERTTKKMNAIFNSVVDGIITINNKGIIYSFNPAAELIFGYKSREVIGKNIKKLMPDSYRVNHDQYILNYLETSVAKVIGIGREVTARRKDGTEFPMDLGISDVQVNEERMFVGVIRDISERKQTEEALTRYAKRMELANSKLKIANDVVKKANASKSEFLSAMSHELRTPMHAILSYSNLGQETIQEENYEEIGEFFQNISVAGERLLGLLNNLLDLAKLESGKMDFRFSLNDIQETIQQAISEIQSLLAVKEIVYIVNIETSDLSAVFDREKIVQVLINLLSNAIKFSPNNSTITLTVQTKNKKHGYLVISIQDQGVGIPESEMETIFEKFTQSSHTNTQAGGTGLGLAICKQIIETHKGSIQAKNNAPGGAIFEFEFPLNISPNSNFI